MTKPLPTTVREALQGILDAWGPDMANYRDHFTDYATPYVGCAVEQSNWVTSGGERVTTSSLGWTVQDKMRSAAHDLGYGGLVTCSDAGPEIARKMVEKALEACP